jgi:hypothetical protein
VRRRIRVLVARRWRLRGRLIPLLDGGQGSREGVVPFAHADRSLRHLADARARYRE